MYLPLIKSKKAHDNSIIMSFFISKFYSLIIRVLRVLLVVEQAAQSINVINLTLTS